MQNNTNLSEDSGSSTKPDLASSSHGHTLSKAPDITGADSGRAPVTQLALPHPQFHGYIDSNLDIRSRAHSYPIPGQPGPAPDIMHRRTSSGSEAGHESTSPTAPSLTTSSLAAPSLTVQGMTEQDAYELAMDGRKAKRELSQSKRAAQNRAAQRAFRQRKEQYIKKLEQQVRDYGEMENAFKAIQTDNYALREYVIQLQSRLLDVQVEPPQPPPNVSIAQPTPSSAPRPMPGNIAADPTPGAASAGTLADVAAAVAGLRARDQSGDANYTKSTFKSENMGPPHPNDEIRRQLQADSIPPLAPCPPEKYVPKG